jgi:hypothetical protein
MWGGAPELRAQGIRARPHRLHDVVTAAGREERGNRRHTCRAGSGNIGRNRWCHAPDCKHRDLSRRSRNPLEPLDANRRVGVARLRSCRERRAGDQVIDRPRQPHACFAMHGPADDHAGRKPTNVSRRHARLAEMHARRARRDCHVEPIVHDDRGPGAGCDLDRTAHQAKEVTRIEVGLAHLHDANPGRHRPFHLSQQQVARSGQRPVRRAGKPAAISDDAEKRSRRRQKGHE